MRANARRIAAALGGWIVRVGHIGSTAVPGLGAKPVIDIMPIMPAVARAQDLDHCVAPLTDLGYSYVPEDRDTVPARFFTARPPAAARAFNVHLVVRGGAYWTDYLTLRDYLRAHPAPASDYERVKRDLAPRHHSVETYAEAKTGFIARIPADARAETV